LFGDFIAKKLASDVTGIEATPTFFLSTTQVGLPETGLA